MKSSVTTALCTRCGLCCDGSLFSDVEISQKESSMLALLGLNTDDEDHRALLIQPCDALENCRCTIYSRRPSCCRTFKCQLLQRVCEGDLSLNEGRKTIADAISRIKEFRALMSALDGTDDSEGLPLKEAFADARMAGGRTRVKNFMSEIESLLRENFLPDW